MNSELPKVDITYGTKRHGNRSYKTFSASMLKIQRGGKSVKALKTSGESYLSNIERVTANKDLLILSDTRMRISDLVSIEVVERVEVEKKQSRMVGEPINNTNTKTFHLILNKAHAVGKGVVVFMKSGIVYKGVSDNHDFDSLSLNTDDAQLVIIMYDAVKRIIPLEADGTLAE
ncbi:hypothetical protein AB204_11585 [Xenorhabdus khoisanae]|uniref:Repressor n=1 Tax=Xenorhabdus khoisanae TaxID=880157 RepID=A0A0J5FRR8_9GAMM|nr:hypothetical protein [Xenorhabdus khoisanae]KMJ44978.1 hypothetical protein AB204_11585 [Xenorhabdus khoisanae]